MPLSSLERKTDRVTFYLILPILVQFLFLKFFLEKWAQVFVCARRWVLHLPPTQKHVFAYGIYATFVWHMFVYLAPRMGSLRQWVGGGTASQSLLLFFIFLVEELWISKWLQLCFFFFFLPLLLPKKRINKGKIQTGKRQWWVGGLYVCIHTPILFTEGQ